MGYECALGFEDGKLPLNIKSGKIGELKKRLGSIREFSESLELLGCGGIKVEAYDMGVDEGGLKRERYGIKCETHGDGKGCETCILKELGYTSAMLSDFSVSIDTQPEAPVLDEWTQRIRKTPFRTKS